MVSRDEIYGRLRIAQLSLTTSRQTIFGSAVPEARMRNIVYIGLIGDGTASRTVDIEKLEEDGTHTMLWNDVPVPPSAQVAVPEGWSFDITFQMRHHSSLYLVHKL